jgi:hypothetical protein
MATSPTTRHTRTALAGTLGTALAGALAAALLLVAGCSGDEPRPDPSTTAGARASATGSAGSVRASASAGHGGSVGTFTAAFARCMRAHGVPNFPDPNGRSGQLGPDSGVDPGSPAYLAALNGPCRSLAPPAWLDSTGPGSVPGS